MEGARLAQKLGEAMMGSRDAHAGKTGENSGVISNDGRGLRRNPVSATTPYQPKAHSQASHRMLESPPKSRLHEIEQSKGQEAEAMAQLQVDDEIE